MEIVRRNVGLVNIHINSISQLREICRKRELILSDIKISVNEVKCFDRPQKIAVVAVEEAELNLNMSEL